MPSVSDDLDGLKALRGEVLEIDDRQGAALLGGKFAEGIAP